MVRTHFLLRALLLFDEVVAACVHSRQGWDKEADEEHCYLYVPHYTTGREQAINSDLHFCCRRDS